MNVLPESQLPQGTPAAETRYARDWYSMVIRTRRSTTTPPANQAVNFRLTGLATGSTYNVAITAVDTAGNESSCSTAASAVAQLEIGVTPPGTTNFGNVNIGSSSTPQTFTVTPGANPVPTTTGLAPASATMGGAAFTLTVNGSAFVAGQSVVRWNGANRATTFMGTTQVRASIPASDLAAIGTAQVTVFDPGSGTSSARPCR